ncbi:MAG: TIGR04552 family protein [Bacteriovoracaceae bacterium]|jgi:uncharacterized protein (TIGR04562 family)|nr:TIGR04552 family protein [Bacteriovoracaceae bacterium]
MRRAEFYDSFNFNWETLDIMASGTSSLDAKNYLSNFKTREEALNFLEGYGYNLDDPIQNAEMFGNFQEAIQFIKKYFLKEGNPDGLDLTVPNVFYSITDVAELLLIATGNSENEITVEDSYWASILLKVMHTILHLDKDLRYRYFSTIQTQIFDRFYKYLVREGDDLFLETEDKKVRIPLVDFETKSKKTRESIIIKLLHKKENVAEELFDRIGIRFITFKKVDCLRVLKILDQNYTITVNNIKPSRSQNSLIDLECFKKDYLKIVKESMKGQLSEEDFLKKIEEYTESCLFSEMSYKNNKHSSAEYKAIHFTCRQLIKYQNPFYQEFNKVRNFAKKNDPNNEVTRRLLSIDATNIANEVRFFYPFEVQITDIKSHEQNTAGEASHLEYKKSQVIYARDRLFKNLLDYKQAASS